MKNFKKSFSLTAVLILLLALFGTGCSQSKNESNLENLTLEELAEKLYEKADIPPHDVIRLDSVNFESFAFIPYDSSLSAVAADALVNITPHSMVVIHAAGGNGEELAKKVIKNADPNKWLCVGSETVKVAYTDHYVILIMSYEDIADAIVGNFKALAKELDGMEMTLLTATNSRYEQ